MSQYNTQYIIHAIMTYQYLMCTHNLAVTQQCQSLFFITYFCVGHTDSHTYLEGITTHNTQPPMHHRCSCRFVVGAKRIAQEKTTRETITTSRQGHTTPPTVQVITMQTWLLLFPFFFSALIVAAMLLLLELRHHRSHPVKKSSLLWGGVFSNRPESTDTQQPVSNAME